MSPPSLTTPPIVEEELEEEELEEEDLSEESLTELKEKMEENVREKDSPHKLFRPREQLMLRANSLKKAVRQIIEQAEKSKCNALMRDLLLSVSLLSSSSECVVSSFSDLYHYSTVDPPFYNFFFKAQRFHSHSPRTWKKSIYVCPVSAS